MFQAVSLPPAVQERSMEFNVILEVNNWVGDGQVGGVHVEFEIVDKNNPI